MQNPDGSKSAHLPWPKGYGANGLCAGRKGVPVPTTKTILLDNDVHRELIQRCSVVGPSVSVQGPTMTALLAKLERFESLAAECDLIAGREADGSRRELYLRLGAHYRQLACDMRSVIASVDAAA